MNYGQREKIVEHLSNGATLRDAVGMVEVPWTDFSREWLTGQREHADGGGTSLSTWYARAQAERARYRSVLRAAVQSATGNRQNALLKLVEILEAEADPEPDAAEDLPGVEVWSSVARDRADDLLRTLCSPPERAAEAEKRLTAAWTGGETVGALPTASTEDRETVPQA